MSKTEMVKKNNKHLHNVKPQNEEEIREKIKEWFNLTFYSNLFGGVYYG